MSSIKREPYERLVGLYTTHLLYSNNVGGSQKMQLVARIAGISAHAICPKRINRTRWANGERLYNHNVEPNPKVEQFRHWANVVSELTSKKGVPQISVNEIYSLMPDAKAEAIARLQDAGFFKPEPVVENVEQPDSGDNSDDLLALVQRLVEDVSNRLTAIEQRIANIEVADLQRMKTDKETAEGINKHLGKVQREVIAAVNTAWNITPAQSKPKKGSAPVTPVPHQDLTAVISNGQAQLSQPQMNGKAHT